MDSTTFLAQLWGPIVLVIGLGYFFSRSFYVRLYKDIQNEPLATLTFGIFAMLIGLLQISVHNIWGSFDQGLISFLGWATLVKSVIFLVFPHFVDRTAEWEVAKKLVGVAGVVLVIGGAYLSWVGYFA